MLRPTMLPITPPATATVDWTLLLLGEEMPLTAPFTEDGELDAGTAGMPVEVAVISMVGRRADGKVLVSGIATSADVLGTVAPGCVASG